MAKSKKTKIVMSARTPHKGAHPSSMHVVEKLAKGKIKNGKFMGSKKAIVKC